MDDLATKIFSVVAIGIGLLFAAVVVELLVLAALDLALNIAEVRGRL